MDLRVKRTKKNINEAFYELRKKKNLEKISVKELSEMAMINKATFYLHYNDIYDLSDKLELDLIDNIIGSVRGVNPFNSREDMVRFAEQLSNSIIKHSADIETLFSGHESNSFIYHLEDRLRQYLFATAPRSWDSPENNILLSFMVQGAYHAHLRNRSFGANKLKKTTMSLFGKLFEEIT